MEYFTESSSDEEIEGAISQFVTEEDTTGAAWYAERSSEEEGEEEKESLNDVDPAKEPTKIASRAYQLEMLDASLKENVIVAMDTGSGKTQVYRYPRSRSCD